MKRLLISISILGSLLFASAAFAQFSGGSNNEPFTAPGLFSINGTTVNFSDSNYEFGDITIQDLTVTTATIGGVVGGDLTFTNGVANANLYLDGEKNVSSSRNFIFDGTSPSTGAGSMAIGVGSATQSTAIVTIDGNNGTNIYGLRLLDQGAGTSGFRYDLSANGDLHIDSSSNIYSGTDFRIGTTNRPMRIQVNSSAFNSGSPYAMAFDALSLPTKVSFQFNGSIDQTADLFNIYNNSASSSPVFAINAQGKTAIGVGASTSTSAQLTVNGAVSSTSFSTGMGTASSPTFNFGGAGDADTGIYSDIAGGVAIAANTLRLGSIRSNGIFLGSSSAHIQPFSNGTTDLGISGNAWRNAWFTGTVTTTNLNVASSSAATATYYLCANAAGDVYKKTTACN